MAIIVGKAAYAGRQVGTVDHGMMVAGLGVECLMVILVISGRFVQSKNVTDK